MHFLPLKYQIKNFICFFPKFIIIVCKSKFLHNIGDKVSRQVYAPDKFTWSLKSILTDRSTAQDLTERTAIRRFWIY